MSSVIFTYKTDASAGDIPAIIHYKPTFPDSPTVRPAVLIFHAGAYSSCGTFIIARSQIDALLDLGFIVITPEYRLSPQVSVFDGAVTDCREALAWSRSTLPSLLQSHANLTLDPARLAVMGHSAGGNLALLLGGDSNPPAAVLNIYGGLFYSRPFFHTPLSIFASVPEAPEEFRAEVFTGPVPFSTPGMMTREGKPDLSNPRGAWMIHGLKHGTHMAQAVGDGEYDRVDGAMAIKPGFPPTAIVHGDADVFAPYEFALEAAEKLVRAGATTKLITVPGQNHMFDLPLTRESGLFAYVQQGFEFLARHV